MKKKTGLFTIITCVLLAIMVVTWLVPAGYFTGSELSELGMYRIGFFDFFQLIFGAFQFDYFNQIIILLLMIGAFYGVLGKTGKYRALTEKIASKFKGKEKAFLIGSSLIIALLTSTFDFNLITFIFIPAIISIILDMKYDKNTAFMATFGAYLVGIIGSTISYNIVVTINTVLKDVVLSDGVWFKIAMFIVSYALLAIYLIKQEKKAIKEDSAEDLFVGEEIHNKYPAWPIILIFSILFVLMILGCVNWSSVFGVTIFDDLMTKITSWTVGKNDTALASIILGNVNAFGKWYYAEMGLMCLFASLIIGAIYKLGLRNTFDAMLEGIKKIVPIAGIVVLVYTVVYFTGNTMSYPTIAGWILGATSKFNLLFASIATILGSFLHVDMLYVSNYVVAQVAANTTNHALVGLLVQSLYGLTMFIVPTSAMLVLGLSYLNIPYKEYVKKNWMFIVELLIAIFVILLLAALI